MVPSFGVLVKVPGGSEEFRETWDNYKVVEGPTMCKNNVHKPDKEYGERSGELGMQGSVKVFKISTKGTQTTKVLVCKYCRIKCTQDGVECVDAPFQNVQEHLSEQTECSVCILL